MLRYLRRIVGLAPATEWCCGRSRSTDLLAALTSGSTATLSLLRNGQLVWERDCSKELHEFSIRCLERLFADAAAQADDAASVGFQSYLPASFEQALRTKREWLRGRADERDLESVVDAVANETHGWWPSNWCYGINALVCTRNCVLSAMDLKSPWSGAACCADNLAMAMSFRAACALMQCRGQDSGPLTGDCPQEQSERHVVTRGVDCPHMEDEGLAQAAEACINQQQADWETRLNNELMELVSEESAESQQES